MKKHSLTFILSLIFLACQNAETTSQQNNNIVEQQTSFDELVSHFQASMIIKAKSTSGYETLGLNDGADAFLLMKIYPGLVPADFTGITTKHGEYSVQEGKLFFTGNAPSDAGVLDWEGYKLLLQHISKRLDLKLQSIPDVDQLLNQLQYGKTDQYN